MSGRVLIVGAGTNGLTTAALLGKAGRGVTVLERQPSPGGLAASEEFHPRYRTAGILHDHGAVRPSLVAALGLAAHGLRRRAAPAPVLAPELDGPGLVLDHDPAAAHAELGARSPADADGYRRYRGFLDQIGGFIRRVLDEPPPDIGAAGVAGAWPLLGRAWAMRRLGRRTMLEVLRGAPMSAADWLGEWFEDPLLTAALAAPAVADTWCGPWSAGTASLLWMHECARAGEIIGGPPAVVRALLAAAESHGVELRTGCPIARIAVTGGRTTGVVLEDGTAIDADVVVSSADPHHTFFDLLEPRDLPAELATDLASWRCRGTTAVLHLALDGPLEWASRPDFAGDTARIGEHVDALEQAFDAVKYRQMAERPMLDVRVPTRTDPTLAPEGHHVVSIHAHFAPYDLDGGWTDSARESLQQHILTQLSAHAPSVRDRIVGARLLTPADLHTRYGLTGGQLHHGEHALDQLFWLRPHASCARYATPIEGLFLCGSGTHPGGGLTCGPGALAAAAIARRRIPPGGAT